MRLCAQTHCRTANKSALVSSPIGSVADRWLLTAWWNAFIGWRHHLVFEIQVPVAVHNIEAVTNILCTGVHECSEYPVPD